MVGWKESHCAHLYIDHIAEVGDISAMVEASRERSTEVTQTRRFARMIFRGEINGLFLD
jgi:hypothetical protein